MMVEYEKSITHLEEGTVVKGKIVAVTPTEVMIDIGYKSEGIVPIGEFGSSEKPKVGDEIEILLESKEPPLKTDQPLAVFFLAVFFLAVFFLVIFFLAVFFIATFLLLVSLFTYIVNPSY